MFNFLKHKENHSKSKSKEEDETTKISGYFAATESAKRSTANAAIKFKKPETYTGNRTLYDSGSAKRNAKIKLFKDGAKVTDPYMDQELVLTKHEAKLLYGDKWQDHLAESDHVKPLEQIHNDTKNNPWVTTDNIKDAANSDDNIKVSSRKFNNPKRSRTNKEYVEDEEYLSNKGVKLTKSGKEKALKDGDIAEKSIKRQINRSSIKNVLSTGHKAGLSGAQSAGITALTTSGIMNVVAVAKGEKEASEAVQDTMKAGGKAAVTGYAMGGGLTVVSHSLSNSSSKFIQALSKSNVPGKIITAVIVTGDTLKKYGNGEITTQECLIELGEKGLNMATMGYSMAVGQALIPIPIVGGAIGAIIGSTLTSTYYNTLISTLQQKQLRHNERLRIIAECKEAAEQVRSYRKELESYLQNYFNEYQDCFDEALSSIHLAYQTGDTNGIISGANQITRKCGGKVNYETVEEFEKFLSNDSVDIF